MFKFNEVFRKHVAFHNIKSHEKSGLLPFSLEDKFLEKPQTGQQIDHSLNLFRVKSLLQVFLKFNVIICR